MRKQFSANTCKQALSTLSTIVPAAPRHSGTVPVRAHIGFRSCVNAQTTDRLDAGPRESDGVCSLRGLDVQRILQDEFGVLRKLPSVYWLLHRLGYSCLIPRSKYRPADPVAQDEFKKRPGVIRATQAAHPTRRVEVFFEDECRFGQQGTLTRVGSQPTAMRQTEYSDLWVIGAVCPRTGQAEAILSPVLNTSIINQFLDQFSRALVPDVQALLIWDEAGFHRSHDLVVPDNITLLSLPPYSPELNPIENLWHHLRSHFWSNRTYRDDDLFHTAEQTWNTHSLNESLIQSVCAANHPYSADFNLESG